MVFQKPTSPGFANVTQTRSLRKHYKLRMISFRREKKHAYNIYGEAKRN